MVTQPTTVTYRDRLLAAYTGGDSSPQKVRAALEDMATVGHNWDMFSAAGNAACAAALADVLARVDTLTEADLPQVIGQAIAQVAEEGYREVGDTEPEVCFEAAANLIALLRGWGEVSRSSFTAHHDVIDALRQADTDAQKAATQRLLEAHRDEFNQYLAAETEARRATLSHPA